MVICAITGDRGEPTDTSQSTETIVLNLVLTEDASPEHRALERTVNTTGQESRHCSGSDRTATWRGNRQRDVALLAVRTRQCLQVASNRQR
jgi:hypothetical protein